MFPLTRLKAFHASFEATPRIPKFTFMPTDQNAAHALDHSLQETRLHVSTFAINLIREQEPAKIIKLIDELALWIESRRKDSRQHRF